MIAQATDPLHEPLRQAVEASGLPPWAQLLLTLIVVPLALDWLRARLGLRRVHAEQTAVIVGTERARAQVARDAGIDPAAAVHPADCPCCVVADEIKAEATARGVEGALHAAVKRITEPPR